MPRVKEKPSRQGDGQAASDMMGPPDEDACCVFEGAVILHRKEPKGFG